MNPTLHNAVLALGRLNPLDWGIAVILCVSTVAAFLRGLIRSLLSLAGVVLGILLACLYWHAVAARLSAWISPASLAEVAAFVIILVGVILIAATAGRLLRGAVSAVGLGFLDRLAGSMFGFARGVLILAAMLLPLAPFIRSLPVAQTSLLLPYLLPAAHGISFVVPRNFGTRLPQTGWLNHAGTAAREAAAIPVRTVPSNAR